MRRLFEVNSELHTGARPSVRLCVGLKTSGLLDFLGYCFAVASQVIALPIEKRQNRYTHYKDTPQGGSLTSGG